MVARSLDFQNVIMGWRHTSQLAATYESSHTDGTWKSFEIAYSLQAKSSDIKGVRSPFTGALWHMR